MESKKYKNKEWLKTKLVKERVSGKRISDICDVSQTVISYWKRKYDIEVPRMERVSKPCSNCGSDVTRLESQFSGELQYCSKKCESEDKKERSTFNCENCGDTVERVPSQVTSEKYYCSKECRHEHQRGENHPRYSTIRIDCEYCEESFERTPSELAKNKNYCSEECYHLDVKTDRDKNSHEYKRWRNEVRNRDDWQCQDCGWTGDRIEAHHIESWSEKPEKRFELDNGKSLCIECHYLTHMEKEEWHSAGLVKGRVDMDRLQNMERYEKTDGV